MARRGKPKFKVGQVVRLRHDYVSSFGWRIKSETLCEIVVRGTTWDNKIQFCIDSLQTPFEVWVNDEDLRPLTKREAGR